MTRGVKLLIILLCFMFCLNIASANENMTLDDVNNTSHISIDSSNVTTGESLSIFLKDSNNDSISYENLTAEIDGANHTLTTDSYGKSSLNLNLKPDSYLLNVFFRGNEKYMGVNQTFNINVLKLDSQVNSLNNTVFKGDYFKIILEDINSRPISDANVTLTINKKNYKITTDLDGIAEFKADLAAKTYSVQINFDGNDYYNPSNNTVNLLIPATTAIVIGNDKLLTNGYLRIYLKSDVQSAVSKKSVEITINGKKYVKTTNSEGIIVFNPKLSAGKYVVFATYDGTDSILKSNATKKIKCVNGNTINPLKSKISSKNGIPNIDLMPKNYVMADDNFTYTVTKNEYKDVIKRDSYCLFLKNKLTKYTFFKSKAEPKLYHMIKREKWNVIERAINTKIVLKNKYNYWPSKITVNLEGKSYTYSEVRDVQDTGYTCGPTSCSMCSQVLRNYVNEWHFAKNADTDPDYGSSTKGLKRSLEKFNMKCSIYYKSSFNKALKELKKGGCALIFHTWGHFVSILDISKDGKKVLVGNPSGDYNQGSHLIPTKWLTVKYMYKRFNNYDTSGLIVKLKYNLNKSTKNKINIFYSNMGKWSRSNTNERIPQI